MSIVSEVITYIRDEVNDESSTRFTDATILRYLKRAIGRAVRIAQREGLTFAKKKVTLTTVSGQEYVNYPTDFDVPIAVYDPYEYYQVRQCSELDWNTIVSASSMDFCYFDSENSRILFKGIPDSASDVYLYYYPKIDTSAYTETSTMPWGGKLDDILIEYVSLRLKNKDEMDVSFDLQLMTDFENNIIRSYRPLNIMSTEGRGWMNG